MCVKSVTLVLLVGALIWLPRVHSEDFAIIGATLLPVSSDPIEGGTIYVKNGKIEAIGQNIQVPEGVKTIDGSGRWVMPGIIDTHSHMGVYPWPWAEAHADGNEMIHALTPHVRAEDAVFLEDPAFERARAGGVTTVQVLPGSGNLQGGQTVVLKLRSVNTLEEMKFEGAPRGMKMAFGENPKRVHVIRDQIMSRMGNSAVMRTGFRQAQEYRAKWEQYTILQDTDHPVSRPDYDPKMETLVDVLDGKIRVHVHCYRKDDLLAVLRISDEFGFKLASFQHGLECYKIASELAKRDIGVATWADWWGFKLEAFDGIPQNAALLANAGIRVNIHSDSSDGVQRLFHEASKAIRYGMNEDHALKALTIWPASMLGVEDRVGSLDVGKDADIAVFSHHPFDVYTLVQQTFIDGVNVYSRK